MSIPTTSPGIRQRWLSGPQLNPVWVWSQAVFLVFGRSSRVDAGSAAPSDLSRWKRAALHLSCRGSSIIIRWTTVMLSSSVLGEVGLTSHTKGSLLLPKVLRKEVILVTTFALKMSMYHLVILQSRQRSGGAGMSVWITIHDCIRLVIEKGPLHRRRRSKRRLKEDSTNWDCSTPRTIPSPTEWCFTSFTQSPISISSSRVKKPVAHGPETVAEYSVCSFQPQYR